MEQLRNYINVEGIVQGVGFRPFVYNLAAKYNLKGWVSNTTEGVKIDIEGKVIDIDNFKIDLQFQAPPLSKIDKIRVEELPFKGYESFTIKKSKDNNRVLTLISPDVSTCFDCKDDIEDINNRRYKYPFTNCTNCGPRFSIIKSLPYDRAQTTMKDFEMCGKCKVEYNNPKDRRFHAQPNACPECGPKLWLTDDLGNKVEVEEPLKKATNLLKEGKIIAVKGLGGFHLVCNGKDKEAVEKLRNRKLRPDKPFAVMMKDIEVVREYCYVNQLEENILAGIRRPILLLDRKNGNLADNIAPNSNKLGVMLPYTPLHNLLFDQGLEVLLMTSANLSGLPIEYKNKDAIARLDKVVDYFLLHDRDIFLSVDDSVSRVILGKERLIRRSRGYAPIPFKVDGLVESLACGSHLKNTFCIAKGGFIFLSQHIGDLDNLNTYNNFKKNIEHFKKIYKLNPKVIAHDLHLGYLSSVYGQNEAGVKVGVQHHHAHIVSCMVENDISKKVIGLAFDGTGLGTDGNIWGGEFLICDYEGFTRAAHLNYVNMPGGEQAVKEPWRMAISHLYKVGEVDIDLFKRVDKLKIKSVLKMLEYNLNSPLTSSMGRLFDTISALIGLRQEISYDAQAAIELEVIADRKEEGVYRYQIENDNGNYIINTNQIIKDVIIDIKDKVDMSIIAKRFHNTIIALSIEICKLLRDKYEINQVALSGGVFQNEIILKGIYAGLKRDGFKVYTHAQIPCNDGGLALGQLVVANYKRRNN
ncbi:carbamoyltransferase HypF [Orenia metallireducens]|uniref:Carbamoyltransferase n=1 Tax=Orenia metallireducens TaxID=1413210 RepID=A0A1C0ABI5_9FIRM|nr:carbamoyltransferase HypF [Orenia metallireducens]OCL27742.1 carbamoyltransferase HypF [Orenia metallireducens]